MAAELRHPDLDRDAGARRMLVEDHAELAAGEEAVLLAGFEAPLQVRGELEHLLQLVARPVRDPEEVAPFHAPILLP